MSAIAKTLGQLGDSDLAGWAASANRVLPKAVCAVLAILLGLQLARLFWLFIPGEDLEAPLPQAAQPTARAGADSGAGSVDVNALVGLHLFGEASQEPEQVVETPTNAPETNLSLTLRGIVAESTQDAGLALIADGRGENKLYRIGDTVPGNAKLHAVEEDRVLLNRAGRIEALSLPKEFEQAAARGRTVRRPTVAPRRQPARSSGSLRNAISANASKVSEVIRVAPQLEQGQMVGFRVNPGRRREEFAALGLQPGDIVTDVNGTAMNDPSKGIQVFEALGESTQATVTVLRSGNPEVLVIDTSQIQSLANNDDQQK